MHCGASGRLDQRNAASRVREFRFPHFLLAHPYPVPVPAQVAFFSGLFLAAVAVVARAS